MMKVIWSVILMCGCLNISYGAESEKIVELLGPAVRVLSGNGGGSGTIVYSEDRERSGVFQTFVLTNHHVIKPLIKVEKTWNSLRQRFIMKENNEFADVELFSYSNGGHTVVRTPVKAEIVAWNEQEDMAILKLKYPFQVKHVAKILPPDRNLSLFQEVYAVGCPLLIDPLFSHGEVTALRHLLETKEFTVASANIIWGNSGGALYAKFPDGWYLSGIPSQVSIAGFFQAVTYLGYHITPERIHKFIKGEELDFLVDPDQAKTPTRAMERRKIIREGKDPDAPKPTSPEPQGEVETEGEVVRRL